MREDLHDLMTFLISHIFYTLWHDYSDDSRLVTTRDGKELLRIDSSLNVYTLPDNKRIARGVLLDSGWAFKWPDGVTILETGNQNTVKAEIKLVKALVDHGCFNKEGQAHG